MVIDGNSCGVSLRARSELFDRLEASPTPSFATDQNDRVIFWNEAATRFFGRSAEDVLGRRFGPAIYWRDANGVGSLAPPSLSLRMSYVQGRHDGFLLVYRVENGNGRARDHEADEAIPNIPNGGNGHVPPLTGREREILGLVAKGLQAKEIAQELDISVTTARNHVQNILRKLGLHSKLEVIAQAYQRGWVSGEIQNGHRAVRAARAGQPSAARPVAAKIPRESGRAGWALSGFTPKELVSSASTEA